MNEEMEKYLEALKSYQDGIEERLQKINELLSWNMKEREEYLESLIEKQAPDIIINSAIDAGEHKLITITEEEYNKLIKEGERLKNDSVLTRAKEEIRDGIKASLNNTIDSLRETKKEIISGIKETFKTWRDNFKDNMHNLYNSTMKDHKREAKLDYEAIKQAKEKGEITNEAVIKEMSQDRRRAAFVDTMDKREADIARRNEENKTASPLKKFFNNLQNRSDEKAIRSSAKAISAVYEAEQKIEHAAKRKEAWEEQKREVKTKLSQAKTDRDEAFKEIKMGVNNSVKDFEYKIAVAVNKALMPIHMKTMNVIMDKSVRDMIERELSGQAKISSEKTTTTSKEKVIFHDKEVSFDKTMKDRLDTNPGPISQIVSDMKGHETGTEHVVTEETEFEHEEDGLEMA